MQADQNNYQPDKQFTDKGWNEMLKTLDKEMPVQEKKRRGFFWLLPFLLIGLVASVWAFYPKNGNAEMTQSQELVMDQNQNQNQNQNSETIAESNLEITNKNLEIENQTTKTIKPPIVNNKAINNDGFPSIIELSNPLLPQVIEVIAPVEKTELIEVKGPLARLEKDIQSINPSFITIELQKEEKLSIDEKEFFFEEETIINKSNLAKRKTEFGAFAGVVGDFAKIKKVGLTIGGFVHFPIKKKLGLRTGLGYSQLQKELDYLFIGNQDAALSNEFLAAALSPLPFSRVAVRSNSNFTLERFHQLDLPVLFTYAPIKKLEIQLGASASFLLKDKTRLENNALSIDDSVNDDYSNYGIEFDALDITSISNNQYSNEDYWSKLNVSGVVGLAWKPTRRINLELQYHHGFFPILKSSRNIEPSLIQGLSNTGYEVFNNFDSNLAERSSIQDFFKQGRFITNNHSLRFTIGYNF